MPQKLDPGSLKIDFSSLNQVENSWCFCFVYPAAFFFPQDVLLEYTAYLRETENPTETRINGWSREKMIVIKDVLWLSVNTSDVYLVFNNKHIQSAALMEKSSALRCVSQIGQTLEAALAARQGSFNNNNNNKV